MRTLTTIGLLLALGAILVVSQRQVAATTAGPGCAYTLIAAAEQPGVAIVTHDGDELRVELSDATPNAVYTVWVDFKSRVTDRLAGDYPVDAGALERGVAPAFAITDGVTAGIGHDTNTLLTDGDGNGRLEVDLGHDLLEPGASPVVGADLVTQGENRVGGGWLRVYPLDPAGGATNQVVDPETGYPLVQRATAQGLTVVRHVDAVTHGHTPGVGGVDHVPGFNGDFPIVCGTSNDG